MSKETDEMGGVEFMTRANVALAGMGRATAALVPALAAMGQSAERIDCLMRGQIAYFNLQWLSGATQEEIKEHLVHYSGSIFDLERFYANWGCFPCQINAEAVGKAMMDQWLYGFELKDLSMLFWDKSPRAVQGVLLLVVIVLMFLAAF